jgi:integrase
MPKKKADGSGTIYKRGNIYWVKIHVDGRPVYESSKSTKFGDAVKLRDRLLAKKTRGEVTGGAPDRVLIGELLDDVLKSDIAESTRNIWRYVIDGNSTTAPEGTPPEKITYGHLRPFFGHIRAARLTTDLMDEYRAKRKAAGRSDSTANRELSILRTAFHNARKRTPPKVNVVPYFPMVTETTVRQGFLSDDQYVALRDALPNELKALFVTAYNVGTRKGELLLTEWDWVDFERNRISLPPHVTKTKTGRVLPIVPGDMRKLLLAAKRDRDKNWPDSPWVFNRSGERIIDFRGAWEDACEAAGVPELTFHDLRRTAVRNMRRAGVPQVVRMKISGHKTDSMERRYNIVDDDDLDIAEKFMAERARKTAKVLPMKKRA